MAVTPMSSLQGLDPYSLEAQQLADRKEMANVLLASSLAPIETPQAGGSVAKISPLAVLGKLAQAGVGNYQRGNLRDEQAKLGERYNADLASGMERYALHAQGGLEKLPEGVQGPERTLPPDPKAAMYEALASKHPVLQQMGQTQLAKSLEPPEIGEVGGTLYNKRTLETMKLKGEQPQLIMHNGDLYEVNPSTGQRKKLDNAPKVSTTINMPKGESEFDKRLGQKQAEALDEDVKLHLGASEAVEGVRAGQKLLAEGINTGMFANVKQGFDKAGASVTGNAEAQARAARTETFKAYIGDIVIPRLKEFGGNDSNEELRYLQAVNAGDITAEPQALATVLGNVERKLQRRMEITAGSVKYYQDKGYNLPTLAGRKFEAPIGRAQVPSDAAVFSAPVPSDAVISPQPTPPPEVPITKEQRKTYAKAIADALSSGGAAPTPQPAAPVPTPQPEASKVINGKTYNKIGGQWYEAGQ